MSKATSLLCRSTLLAALAITITSCERAASPLAPEAASLVSDVESLIVCAVDKERIGEAVIGEWGGSIQIATARLEIPAGAVSRPTHFRMVVPSSPHVEVDITAVGHASYQFAKPVQVTLSYSRCDGNFASLAAWYIDPSTDALLQRMGGSDDSGAKKFTFYTDHLSAYALAD